jgi:hypothetical protein
VHLSRSLDQSPLHVARPRHPPLQQFAQRRRTPARHFEHSVLIHCARDEEHQRDMAAARCDQLHPQGGSYRHTRRLPLRRAQQLLHELQSGCSSCFCTRGKVGDVLHDELDSLFTLGRGQNDFSIDRAHHKRAGG